MDFALDPAIRLVQKEVGAFVRDHVVPLETDRTAYDAHENVRSDRLEGLRARAKAAGLWAPQMPRERGGLGLPTVGLAACYEEINWSILGPSVFNCAAPDDGNMMLLNRIATEAQKERWLQPIIDGRIRSAYALPEPTRDAGAEPATTRATATRRGDHWVVRGRERFVTGGGEAQHFILVARTSNDARRGSTAFVFDHDQPGWRVGRRMPMVGPGEHGGDCELVFDGLEIPDENRLMEVGDGLEVTQIRLGTARLTHCMRWLGLSRRCLDVASEYVASGESGLERPAREGVQSLLGEAAVQIQVGRLLTMHAAWKIDQNDQAQKEVSMARVAVADVFQKAVDTATHLCGAHGPAKDTPLERIQRYARQAHLVEGDAGVHKTVVARQFLAQRSGLWAWE